MKAKIGDSPGSDSAPKMSIFWASECP